MGYKGAKVGRVLRIAGPSVSQCIERGKILVNTEPEMYQKLINYQRKFTELILPTDVSYSIILSRT
jgi:hypothetical protein